jgi:dipeptidyl-peptidase-3
MKQRLYVVVLFTLLSALAFGQTAKKSVAKTSPGELVDRVGTTGFIQLHADSFNSLTPKQKELAYWLSQAAIAIDPIIYEQQSRFGVRQKRLLEEVISHSQGVNQPVLKKITEFAKLFWASRGNHNELTAQKFLPDFTFEELQAAAIQAQKNGAFKSGYADLPALDSAEALTKEIADLKDSLFDPEFEPMITAKSPQGGKDIIQASTNSFYGPNVSLADLKDFQEKYPLNSNVVKGDDGNLKEEVWRAGTADGNVPAGVYATYLKKANEFLAEAQKVADPAQAQVIGDLIKFYETGEFQDWLKFGEDWVKNDATVDFANGFIEVYRDARGQKGSSQAFVSVTDKPLTDAMVKLASNADYFEQHAPWDDKYKKQNFTPPTVKAIETVIETGDFHVNTIGDNLPNENQIREQFGTKNFLFTASSRAFDAAGGHKAIQEFGATPEVVQRNIKYGQEAEELHTAMHEVIGHGSGRLNPKFKSGTEGMLKEYYSTMEETRADLMALWNAFDPKLKQLGLLSNQFEVAKAMYDSQALVMLTQLRRIPKGTTIEEDHQRNRALIANYIMETSGAIKMFDRNGKTYVQVVDYPKMHEAVGKLLAEIMRTKAEGDYDALKALIDKYGVHFDPKLRDQVVKRYSALNIPAYWAGINPELDAKMAGGKVQSVRMQYPKDAVHQYIYYGSMYGKDLKVPQAKGVSTSKLSVKKATATKEAEQPK